ncbi:MAG: helix-turn-helix transcriptional regulator [Spirochaetales bacterium]|nr:helix-turn-helix transcriptional regulator [Spirochaetales bacterium]
MKLVTHLTERRKAAGLTQSQLAEIVGVSRKTINTVENGVFIPSTVLSLRLARALSCSIHDLFELPQE